MVKLLTACEAGETKTKISDALVGNTNKKGQPRAEGAGLNHLNK